MAMLNTFGDIEADGFSMYEPFELGPDSGYPESGCQFCFEPEGGMVEYQIYNSMYRYFSCSKEMCLHKAEELTSSINNKCTAFVIDIAPHIQLDSDAELPILTIGGEEYIIDTGGDVVFPQILQDRSNDRLNSQLPQVIAKHWLPSEIWEDIFHLSNKIEDDNHQRLNVSVYYNPERTYSGYTNAVTDMNFSVLLRCYSKNGDRVVIHDVEHPDSFEDDGKNYTIINGWRFEVFNCGNRYVAVEWIE